jgi:hypothetical protein
MRSKNKKRCSQIAADNGGKLFFFNPKTAVHILLFNYMEACPGLFQRRDYTGNHEINIGPSQDSSSLNNLSFRCKADNQSLKNPARKI